MLRITRSAVRDKDSLCVIEIAFPTMGLIERSRVVVSKIKVEGQLGCRLVIVLNERSISVLAIAEVRNCRNSRAHRQTQKHVGQTVTAAISRRARIRRELAAEGKVAAGLANLQKIELIKAELRTQF